MSLVPSHAELIAHLHHPWHLSWEGHAGIEIELLDVAQGVAMNSRYECYSAIFRQPSGIQLPQYTYLLHSPAAVQWPVMLTPIGPDEEGEHHLLQAVFHCRLPI